MSLVDLRGIIKAGEKQLLQDVLLTILLALQLSFVKARHKFPASYLNIFNQGTVHLGACLIAGSIVLEEVLGGGSLVRLGIEGDLQSFLLLPTLLHMMLIGPLLPGDSFGKR